MKAILLLMAVLITLPTMAAKEARKVSSSNYFNCIIEREGEGKQFKKSVLFPFPVEKGESYEIKGSMRWNKYVIVFNNNGEVNIKISENFKGKMVESTLIHQMGKEAEFGNFKVKLELKSGEQVVPYSVACGPE